MKTPSKYQLLENAVNMAWYSLPKFDSTFGPCSRKDCTESARGCGVCIACVEKDLASLVGDEMAQRYILNIHLIRQMEDEMRERIKQP